MATQLIQRETEPAGFIADLTRAEKDVASLTLRCEDHPGDLQSRVRLVYRMFHWASLTGRMDDLKKVERAIGKAIAEFGPKEDLCLIKANLDFRLHRLVEVRRDLEMAPLLAGRFDARVMLADLVFQQGQYQASRSSLEELIAENPTWDAIARLAHWHSKLGDDEEADRLYEQAEEELTAKQMLSYAWIQLQRGMLDFNRGAFAEALAHYRRAEAGYPGHWRTTEHLAELLAAQGNFHEAERLLLDVIARTSKPEIQQALGELYLCADRAEEAEPLFDRALAIYLDSMREGDVHYLHHLADLYSDARLDPGEALKCAATDCEMRDNFATQATLAWALYRNGQIEESIKQISLALTSGVQDAIIFSTASELFHAAGETEKSRTFANMALTFNPQHRKYRMHH